RRARYFSLYTSAQDSPEPVWILDRRSGCPGIPWREDISFLQLRGATFSAGSPEREISADGPDARGSYSGARRQWGLEAVQPESNSGNREWDYVSAGYLREFQRALR